MIFNNSGTAKKGIVTNTRRGGNSSTAIFTLQTGKKPCCFGTLTPLPWAGNKPAAELSRAAQAAALLPSARAVFSPPTELLLCSAKKHQLGNFTLQNNASFGLVITCRFSNFQHSKNLISMSRGKNATNKQTKTHPTFQLVAAAICTPPPEYLPWTVCLGNLQPATTSRPLSKLLTQELWEGGREEERVQ